MQAPADKQGSLIDVPLSEISVVKLIDDGLVTLHREMKRLMSLSVSGKLEPNNARDLRDYIKLLFELKDREDSFLKSLSDEQLKEKAKEVLNNENE